MKIEHKLEPLMQIKERKDNIQIYGCYQVGFNFMLKTDIEVPVTFMQEFIPRMMKAACDEIEKFNKEEEAKCHTPYATDVAEATILSSAPLEKKSPIPPLVLEP